MTGTKVDFLNAARGELGYVESPPGSNRTKYGEWYGINPGAWCAMFVSWCADRAGIGAQVHDAVVLSLIGHYQSRGRFFHSPQVGDIVTFRYRTGYHCGIVETVYPNGTIQTIEGNTDVRGGRTGGRVMRQTRSSSIVGYCRPAFTADAPTPPVPPLGRNMIAVMDGPGGDKGFATIQPDGGVFNYEGSQFYGSMGGHPLNKPVVGGCYTPDGGGYWLVAEDGGIFCFGNAGFYGSMGAKPLNKPIVAMAASRSGRGYWMVASDGGLFAFGDAQYFGSLGDKPLSQPIAAIARLGDGYLMMGKDGGLFAFGCPFLGAATSYPADKNSIQTTLDGGGYYINTDNGQIYSFGTAIDRGAYVRLPPEAHQGMRVIIGVHLRSDGSYEQVSNNAETYAF